MSDVPFLPITHSWRRALPAPLWAPGHSASPCWLCTPQGSEVWWGGGGWITAGSQPARLCLCPARGSSEGPLSGYPEGQLISMEQCATQRECVGFGDSCHQALLDGVLGRPLLGDDISGGTYKGSGTSPNQRNSLVPTSAAQAATRGALPTSPKPTV